MSAVATDLLETVSDFRGRRVLVTGAGSGIGLAISRKLLARGAEVIAVDLRIDDIPNGAVGLSLDVSNEAQIAESLERVKELGPIDTLFNNAGIGSTKNVLECEVDEWDRVFNVNVRGTYLMCKHLLPSMLENRYGVIVNTASAAGLIGLPDRAAYCASKGAVIALTKQIAVQWASEGIRCNTICPGTVDSPWVGRLIDEAEDPVARRQQLVGRQPMGRLGAPGEVAEAAIYLASDAAAFITGTDLVIDGGITAG
ncbi:MULTISPECIES: SDR family NAD(P)-dependent oxidoreductase [unclassified Nocardioides]|uniref:SDR family NAD(P)-dependent oxidoreductase n=1 Tax=unclassified Nocardioides TaxID=2615069 RepID=UPI0006FB719F|nr:MULTISPECIES: SDR family NAD(P)-dependent oxidoreductase [unclassified Nocardioides]KRA37681.1 short-chain dehydrogenase [Nocardioides sp. Root614]KRA91641.1 short-chain dehydrogenase [Nocardioides sp. Root682]